MMVNQILQTKTGDAVVTVKPGTSVSDAIRVLAERKIGTVVVSPDGKKASGILSERDVVRELSAKGASVLSDTVDDHMTAKLITCTGDDRSDDVLSKMTSGRFRHMPVVENGQLVGLVTLGDVVKARLSELAMEKDALEGMIMGH